MVRESDRIRIRPHVDPEPKCAACAGTSALALGMVAIGGLLAGRAALRRRRL